MDDNNASAAAASSGGSVEVVLCTYNGERFVAEQLQSIVQQTRPVSRLVIRDDGSTDGTLDVVERCLRESRCPPQVEIRRNERRLGYAANFAQGLADAVCDVVLPCDQDDVWEPERVQVLTDLLEASGADLVFSDGTPIDREGRPLPGPTVLQALGLDPDALGGFAPRAWDELLRRNVVNGAACAVRRVAAQAALPLPEGMPHDQWLALWCAAGNGVAVTARRLYRYRQHGGNVIGMGSQRRLYQWLGIWRQPRRPRRRELAIWHRAAERLEPRLSGDRLASLRHKLRFLEEVVAVPGAADRGLAILRHGLRGDYRRLAPDGALARDLLGLFRDPDAGSAR